MLTYQAAILVFGRLSNIWYIFFIAHFQPEFDRTYIPLCWNYNHVKFEKCARYISLALHGVPRVFHLALRGGSINTIENHMQQRQHHRGQESARERMLSLPESANREHNICSLVRDRGYWASSQEQAQHPLSLALSWALWCCLCCTHVIFNRFEPPLKAKWNKSGVSLLLRRERHWSYLSCTP